MPNILAFISKKNIYEQEGILVEWQPAAFPTMQDIQTSTL